MICIALLCLPSSNLILLLQKSSGVGDVNTSGFRRFFDPWTLRPFLQLPKLQFDVFEKPFVYFFVLLVYMLAASITL